MNISKFEKALKFVGLDVPTLCEMLNRHIELYDCTTAASVFECNAMESDVNFSEPQYETLMQKLHAYDFIHSDHVDKVDKLLFLSKLVRESV